MVVSHDDAQDVLQNTFLQIHLHLAQLRNAEQERAWVFKIATNEALQWLRSKHEWVSMEDEDTGVYGGNAGNADWSEFAEADIFLDNLP